ncbi:aminotransferase class IV [Streptomyces marianii]|uniref:Branched-chain amino acid aminotransferase n=1 Tax=Streptomyces marianii TaxID=1817406 RepID=A0A5R9EAY0_9ACTN|nr:aminotransferase class IV [Streptomyces marianii]TLQ47178.1 branched-chain amino acid aminotransferase [Streptomyces marianii]
MTTRHPDHTATGSQRRPAPRMGLGTWAYDRGEFVHAAEPRLPLSTQALHYGTGTFEGIRAYRSDRGSLQLFRVREHYERMLRACRVLRITDIPTEVEDLIAITVELIGRNNHDADVYIRPLAHKLALLPDTPPGVSLAGVSDGLSITTFGFPSYGIAKEARCGLSTWRRPPRDSLPTQHKITGGYVTSALASDQARAAGYDDALLLDGSGHVAEATTANVFAVAAGRVLTPPGTSDILPGITRDTLITLCRESGTEVLERELSPSDVFTADEVFLSSTGNGVVPVVGLAGRVIGNGAVGEVTRRLADLYDAVTRHADGAHPEWRLPVNVPEADGTPAPPHRQPAGSKA